LLTSSLSLERADLLGSGHLHENVGREALYRIRQHHDVHAGFARQLERRNQAIAGLPQRGRGVGISADLPELPVLLRPICPLSASHATEWLA
jgi:hypothetical protein